MKNKILHKRDYRISNRRSFYYRQPSRPQKALKSLLGINGPNFFWSKYIPRNFGDWITPYLYTKATGRLPIFQPPETNISTIFGAGSIFRHIRVGGSALVWGSGLISHDDSFESPKDILMVRGPLTRKVLRRRSIPCPESFGDPGLMLPEVFRPDTRNNKYALGVVPHFKEISIAGRLFGGDFIGDEIRLIDPTQPIEEVIKQTLSCQAVVSSSLHGIVICHAYGVRCGWVRFSPESAKVIDGDGIKFLDHLSAIGLKDFIRKPLDTTDADISVRRLLTHGLNSPVPDPTHLVDNVKKTCPFL